MIYAKILSEVDRAHVFQLVAAASVCWSNIDGAGAYDADKATELAEDFCDYLVGTARVNKSG